MFTARYGLYPYIHFGLIFVCNGSIKHWDKFTLPFIHKRQGMYLTSSLICCESRRYEARTPDGCARGCRSGPRCLRVCAGQ